MKVFVFTLLIVPTVVLAVAPDLTLYNAQRHGANVKFILRVIDQDGRPVSGAKISGGFQTGGNLNDNVPIRGVTDANGEYKYCEIGDKLTIKATIKEHSEYKEVKQTVITRCKVQGN